MEEVSCIPEECKSRSLGCSDDEHTGFAAGWDDVPEKPPCGALLSGKGRDVAPSRSPRGLEYCDERAGLVLDG